MSYCFRNVRAIFFLNRAIFKYLNFFLYSSSLPFFCSLSLQEILQLYIMMNQSTFIITVRTNPSILKLYVKFTYFFDTPCQNKNQSNCGFIHHHSTEIESCKQQYFKSSQALLQHHYLYQLIRVSEIVKIVDVRKFISTYPQRGKQKLL